MARSRYLPAGPAGDAARLVLSGALGRRIAQLERLLSPPSVRGWTPAGMPFDRSSDIRHLLLEARHQASAQQYTIAVRTYQDAERMFQESLPTIRKNRRRAQMEQAEREVSQAERELRRLQRNNSRLRRPARIVRTIRASARKGALQAQENRADARH
jgi:hypothetical protein